MKVTFRKFLLYERRVIIMYALVMGFITIVLSVEPKMSIHPSNMIYIHFVSFFLFSLYLIIEFIHIKRRFEKIAAHWNNGVFIGGGMGDPVTYEQYLYEQFFQLINQTHQEKMLSVIKDKQDALEFITSWFHEIKTPISVSRLIIGKSPQIEEMKSIDEEIDHIETYVEQALYFVRADDFNNDYFVLQVSLDQLVNSVIKQHMKVFIRKKIRLDLQVERRKVVTDKKWLAYILSQIISNALKYTTDRGIVTISAEEDEKEIRLIISDNGIGIEQADLTKVFEKGFTGMNGRIYGKSTGMGLYLANKLANKLGHKLTIASKEKEYTAITIHFSKGQDYYSIL
ncbi:sensor histidine kinase [Metabacillus fastidiosus]|uniref:sensor histidine kinase n=1 Tax=Metabacillus fastidiosus TaxID=1458 RepID=UPI002DBF4706|nr:sensor histidine kinase [Metabacillus fastidiosus]MEC2076227.1 sensor histidine kinase [Metabacillus fastidiosus]